MCERCTITECAFGSREPLPPKIASLDVKPTTSPATEDDKPNLRDEHDTDVKALGSSAATTSASQPSTSTSPEIYNSTVVTSQEKSVTRRNAMSSALPTSGPDIHVQWSDVAAIGSKALQPRATKKDLEITMPYSILVAIMKNADILDELMLSCPDFPTLFSFVASCKTAKCAFERHSQGIVKVMLRRLPQELRYLTVALIGINDSQISNLESIKALMETWLGMGPRPLTERLKKNPFEIIKKLARTFSAIDVFTEVIQKNCVDNFTDYKTVVASRGGLSYYDVMQWSNTHPLLQQTEWSDVPDDTEWDVPGLSTTEAAPQEIALPLNDREMYRIKRALLRYEVFCALFYLRPDRYFDTRLHPRRSNPIPESSRRRAFREDQVIFLKEYVNPWEVGELAVITQFMYDLVRHAYFHKYMTLRYDQAYESWYGRGGDRNHGRDRHRDHDEVVDEFDNHMVWFTSQGLGLLRRIYDDRQVGYQALIDKHYEPRYRLAEFFVPFEKCAARYGFVASDLNASWKPRTAWSDTPGMELPTKGWLAKTPVSDDTGENDAYWGEKWMRKVGYCIWDRD